MLCVEIVVDLENRKKKQNRSLSVRLRSGDTKEVILVRFSNKIRTETTVELFFVPTIIINAWEGEMWGYSRRYRIECSSADLYDRDL